MLSSVLLLGAGIYALTVAGATAISVVFLAIGVAVSAVTLFDFPLASTFTPWGVERRMLLRRHRMSWHSVDQLTRTRPGLWRIDRGVRHGGLVAVRGRRRYLLVDRAESEDEFDRMLGIAESDGADLASEMLLRPGAGVPPTWLYRRRDWRPDR